jgi:hypothetical protein
MLFLLRFSQASAPDLSDIYALLRLIERWAKRRQSSLRVGLLH